MAERGRLKYKILPSLANGRRNKNFIHRIRHNRQWAEGNLEIGNIFSDHFQSLFGIPIANRFLIDWPFLFNYQARVDLSSLDLPFTIEEIKQAVCGLNVDKALGPDGFPIFFQKHWNLIQKDLIKLCGDFYDGSINYEHLNQVHIALIAKKSTLPLMLLNSDPSV